MAVQQAQTLRQVIEAHAHQLGFLLVGVTTPDPPPHIEVFENWLLDERHGSMDYLGAERSRQRRADPRRILPECRSILVLGIRYPAPEASGLVPSSTNDRSLGKVASYAWNEDYHDVLIERLKILVAQIEAHLGRTVPNRWYTDTGPILEREMAQRAGLGWIGKNTCLITPRQGSYFLLAEVLLGADLEPDLPFVSDHCGSCTRCLDACPTSCILPNRTIDSRYCISYLTIELKTSIPQKLRPLLGDWVFGCDVCQMVCPWNQRFALPQGEPAFSARPGVARPDLIQELDLTPESFNRKFKGSPVKRTKRRGYLRNVAVALGNSAGPAAVPALRQTLLSEPEPLIRGHAAWALGRIGGEDARQALLEAAEGETDPEVRSEISIALKSYHQS